MPLEAFFRPRAVAVIGASETPDTVGHTLIANLTAAPFGGAVYPVNPNRKQVLGIEAYPTVGEVPVAVDLAVVATPAATVPGVIRQCVEKGVGNAVVISAGFREAGAEGAKLEAEILEIARGKMRIIGPNSLGVMIPPAGLNATFANAMARPGNVAFLSQSGALCTAILDWSLQEAVGFSAFVSIGSMMDVGWADFIHYLRDDPKTHSILLYMESAGDARMLLSAARAAALSKPVIVLKPGRSEAGAKAAMSHTGALTGSDEVFDAAFRRCGVVRVETIAELFYAAEVLAKQPMPEGPRLTIVTNAGGPGVLAADAILSAGGELTALAPQTIEKLNAFLPAHWSHGNPVDIIGDADPERYGRAVEIAAEDPGSNGLLAILAPQGIADPALVADKLTHLKKRAGKPLLASWMGGASVAAGDRILTRAGIPTFPYPDTAARLFERMWRRSDNLRALYETPSHVDGGPETGSALIETARQNGRTLLTEAESKAVLQHYGIPVVPARLAHDEDHAVALAEEIGYPVVLKLDSETIVHKAAAGGVHLDLRDADAVRTAFRALEGHATVQPFVRTLGGSFELILGCSVDPQFGPVILFGSGGRLVEIIRDRSLALPPLNTTLARRLIERTRIYRALAPGGVDLAELERILVRFSRFALAEPWIREIDINPLLAGREQIVGLDARIVLHGPEVKREQIPRPAIRPYPREYAGAWSLRDGSTVMIRPVAPEDEPLMVEFHRHLSERSVYLRYFQMLPLHRRIDHERLTRICFNDYDHEIAIVAERTEPREILGVGRLTRDRNRNSAEFAALVADRCQGQGLGRELVRRLLSIAADEGIRVVHGQVLGENRAMMKICQSLGFSLRSIGFNDPLEARIEIDGTHRDQP